MNKKLLMFTLMPLVLSVMTAPAMAKSIGPQKAVGKNPNIMPTPEGVEALLPSGGVHSWTNDTDFWYFDFVHMLDASKAKGIAHKALPLTLEYMMELMDNETAALEAENKWWYMSYDVLLTLFIMENPENVTVLTANATVDQRNVTVDNASLFDVGDNVLIANPTAMELNVIEAKVDNTLTMENNLINNYTVPGSVVIKSQTAEEMAAMWPEGMYVRVVNVGRVE